MTKISFRRLPHSEGLPLPSYATAGSVGLDLCAAHDVWLYPSDRGLIETGFCVAIPEGFEGQVRPRSGLAAKHGIMVVNSPGTIDSDYRGEIKVILMNAGTEAWSAAKGERIAQLVIAPVVRAEIVEADNLERTTRGSGGFGSTGQ